VICLALLLSLLAPLQAAAALSCADLASVAQAAALARAAGEAEDSLSARIPDIVAHLLADGDTASASEIEAARQLALITYRARLSARDAARRTAQQCGGKTA